MKKIILPLICLLFLASQTTVFAQCGDANQTTFITSQTQVDALADCEAFTGDLSITGDAISSLQAMSSLLMVAGNLNIYDTSIESLAGLENILGAGEINIYNNANLNSCCQALEWGDAIDLGSIQSVNLLSNSAGCNSYVDAQAACLGMIAGCTDAGAINYNPEATLDDGNCQNGPDLQVSVGAILNSIQINTFSSDDECLVTEGCITGTGERSTLRFTTTISNYGNEDFIIGQSGGAGNLNPNFYWDDCHGHAHFEGYANYQIYSYPGLEQLPLFGHKNGWCVMDLGGAVSSEAPENANYPSCTFTYGCSYMGISAGCSDTYGSGITCQWLDITDLEDGEYILAVSTNKETDNYTPQYETDYSNNTKYILFGFVGDDITSASEFDGSSISDICSPDVEITNSGYNFSEGATVNGAEVTMPMAFLSEYYTEAVQFVLPETVNLNGTIAYVDSLEINEVSGLPVGLSWACEPQSCSFPVGTSCAGLTGIPELSGNYELSMSSTIYLIDDEGMQQAITLPYTGDNSWLNSIIGADYSDLAPFSPTITMNVELPVYGCMDVEAMNYNPEATFEDGSCESYNYGCTDSFALNYDEDANTEDGSCEYCLEGAEYVAKMILIDSYGDGWNGNSFYVISEWADTVQVGTLESGSYGEQNFCLAPGCYVISVPSEGGWPYEVSWELIAPGFEEVYVSGECPDIQPLAFLTECENMLGCMDEEALNYNPAAEFEDGSCAYPVYGCMDELALNYNPEATDEDGSCQYPLECDETTSLYVLYLHDSYGDGWNGNDFTISSLDLSFNYSVTMAAGFESIESFCLNDNCYGMLVDGGTWQNEITWELYDEAENLVLEGGAPFAQYIGLNSTCVTIEGCTDPLALNYYDQAGVDDGSCVYEMTCEEGFNEVHVELFTDSYPGETSWEVIGTDGLVYMSGDGFTENYTLHVDSTCVPSDEYMTLNLYDSYGDALMSGDGGYFNLTVCDTILHEQVADYGSLFTSIFMGCEGVVGQVWGCSDSTAMNYDELVDLDDGSCVYPVQCDDQSNLVVMELNTDPWAYETSWDLISETGDTLLFMNGYENNTTYLDSVCVPINQEITFNMYDSYGDGLTSGAGDGSFILHICGEQVYSGSDFGYQFTGVFYDCEGAQIVIFGCTDENAMNYSPDATTDDGTCEYEVVFGCMDAEAINYNAEATDEDGSCEYLSCEFYESLVHLNLFSNNGNGWEGLEYQLNSFDGSVVYTGTLNDGFEGTDYFCLEAGCYLITVPEYMGNEDFNWSITIEDKKVLSGTDGMKEFFGVNEICEIVFGCIDQQAINYNPLANYDDGSCTYPNYGVQQIEIAQGWNMISTYIQPSDMSVESVMEQIVDELIIVKNNEGLSYLPAWDYNGIGDISNTEGYLLKVSSAQTLYVEGIELTPEAISIPLSEGWNITSYLRQVAANTVAVFANISDDVLIVKDAQGLAYLPAWDFNGIGDMEPGKGYQVKMTNPNVLQFLANNEEYRMASSNVIDNKAVKNSLELNTGSNMHLVIPENSWHLSVADADEIYAYDAEGNCVGASKITLPTTVLTIWGDDETTTEKEALFNVEAWTLKLWSAKTDSWTSVELKESIGSTQYFVQDAVIIAEQIILSDDKSGLALFNCEPNPASNQTKLRFYLDIDTELDLILYNSLGAQVKVLASGTHTKGYHHINMDVNTLPAGSYFYRLKTDMAQVTKRLEIIR